MCVQGNPRAGEGILSDEQFEKAEINADDIFGTGANRNKLYQLEEYLDNFLNGSVFPLPSGNDTQTKHVQKVAGVFKGDDPESSQQVLFDIYDFSYVPIETLSVVYQQFLHAKDQGRSKGAYYTPVHLVNFILDELDAKKPLKEGMKIFDPSCGSGAFLVQCYRRLVEKVVRNKDGKLKPTELRKLLVDHIFGLDADEEACRVAELSLSLTLLDYIEPHDLRTYPTFILPKLHNKNVFHCEGGFFDHESLWTKSIPKEGYDWIVGNPPWKNIDKKKDKELYDRKAIEWMDSHKKLCPVDNYQTAEAFAWKTTELLAEDGQCGILMPAMTLFKKQGHEFRAKFFSEIETWCIVNFANIRRYLFEKAINPAAAFFYSGKKDWNKSEHYITTYAPFAVEQLSQLNQKGRSKKIWSVFVNYSTIKEIPIRDVENGSAVSWKIAMWGTHRDKCLLDIISRRYDDILAFKSNSGLLMNQGPEFRSLPTKTDLETPEDFEAKVKKFNDNHEYLPEYVDKYVLDTDKVHAGCSHLPDDPDAVCKIMGKDEAYLRTRGGKAGLELFKAPHIIISASRSFSVYSEVDFMIPPRQIGIAGEQKKLLKPLALYLNSKFVTYQQWLTSAAWGIERDRPNLDDLKKLPTPLACLSDAELTEWANLHDEIVAWDKRERASQQDTNMPLFNSRRRTSLPSLDTLLKQMNDKVYNLLGISKKQQWLIEDMLDVRMKLNDGNFTAEKAIKPATEEEIYKFVCIFQEELDLFLDHTGKRKVHKVKVLYTGTSAVIIVDHLVRSMSTKPEVVKVQDNQIRQELDALQDRLTETRSQWMYFTRCLQIHEARRTYIFKPRWRLYWLKSQALAEADDFIAEKLETEQ
ncbi:MAG TPA: N-6 DNA methylase [Sedimentisphaerales bacterium]|nr:N-6 DNA methylase [Sedimentisphaerales bacterium]